MAHSLHHLAQLPNGFGEQVSTDVNQPHGTRELSADEARVAFEGLFVRLLERVENERIVRAASGVKGVPHV